MKKTKMMKKNYEFRTVLSKGQYYTGKGIEAFIQKQNQKEYNSLGIAIGVKIGKAVTRNYIKRLIRENYRLQEENIKTGYRIVFLWKKKVEAKQATFQSIQNDMKKIFDKANLIEGNHEKITNKAN